MLDLIRLPAATVAAIAIALQDFTDVALWDLFQPVRIPSAQECPKHLLHNRAAIIGERSRANGGTNLSDEAGNLPTAFTAVGRTLARRRLPAGWAIFGRPHGDRGRHFGKGQPQNAFLRHRLQKAQHFGLPTIRHNRHFSLSA